MNSLVEPVSSTTTTTNDLFIKPISENPPIASSTTAVRLLHAAKTNDNLLKEKNIGTSLSPFSFRKFSSQSRDKEEDDLDWRKREKEKKKKLVVALHVIFPDMVLPALDLLERGCVIRVVCAWENRSEVFQKEGREGREGRGRGEEEKKEELEENDSCYEKKDTETVPDIEETTGAEKSGRLVSFYLVQSRHQGARNRKEKKREGGKKYLVRTLAWQCSCAAFAFSACASDNEEDEEEEGRGDNFATLDDKDQEEEDCANHVITSGGGCYSTKSPEVDLNGQRYGSEYHEQNEHRAKEESPWEFGGISMSGHGSVPSSVPLCKHLFACVLAERWPDVLGSYVDYKTVSKEDMAGLVVEL